MDKLINHPRSRHGLSLVPRCFRNTHFVFVSRDGHREPPQQPYDGRYPGDKSFLVIVWNREVVNSTDHLKPGHVDLTGP